MMRYVLCILALLLSCACVHVLAEEVPAADLSDQVPDTESETKILLHQNGVDGSKCPPETPGRACTPSPVSEAQSVSPHPSLPLPPVAPAGAEGDTCPGDGTSVTCNNVAVDRSDVGGMDLSTANIAGPTVQLPEAPQRDGLDPAVSTSTKGPEGAHPAGAQAEEEN
ncbi:uncharacterized protein TM35_001021070, partial [Trypanosoma theileri]